MDLIELNSILEYIDSKINEVRSIYGLSAARFFRVGQRVAWNLGSQFGEGVIKKIYKKTITLKLGGVEVTRHGTSDNPAFLIDADDGQVHLMLSSQVSPTV